MNKLLRSNFSRLWKSRLFWLETALMFGFGIFLVVGQYFDALKYDDPHSFDEQFFVYTVFIGCLSAVFCSLFTGTEHSDGTIRNKLIIGHHRSSIYLSNWITSIVAAMAGTAAYLLAYCSLGCFLLKSPVAAANKIAVFVLISLFMIVAFVSLFHMLSMLITKKSTSAVVCLLVFFGLLVLAIIILGKLDAPEYISYYTVTVNGRLEETQELNPRFLQPSARKVYQFFLDLLPTGQSISLMAFRVVHPYLMMVYSAVISAVATALGIAVFRKKDLK